MTFYLPKRSCRCFPMTYLARAASLQRGFSLLVRSCALFATKVIPHFTAGFAGTVQTSIGSPRLTSPSSAPTLSELFPRCPLVRVTFLAHA